MSIEMVIGEKKLQRKDLFGWAARQFLEYQNKKKKPLVFESLETGPS